MAVHVIDTIKPKNGGSFPIVEAVDVKVDNGVRLPDALSLKANITDLEEVETAIETKADVTAVLEATTNLQNQINNIVSPTTEDAEVINSRVGADGTSYATLKARLDAENDALSENVDEISNVVESISRDIGVSSISLTGDLLESGYYSSVDGTKQGSSSFVRSKKLYAIDGGVFYKSGTSAQVRMCLYDENKEFISHIYLSPANTTVKRTILPANAKYCGVFASSSETRIKVVKMDSSGIAEWRYPFDTEHADYSAGYWMDGNGDIRTSSDLSMLSLYNIAAGDKYYISNDATYNCICFDANGTVLTAQSTVSGSGKTYVIPYGTVVAYFNFYGITEYVAKSSDNNVEVEQARAGVDGTSYATLKERLDSEYESQASEVMAAMSAVNDLELKIGFTTISLSSNDLESGYYSSVNGTKQSSSSYVRSKKLYPIYGGFFYRSETAAQVQICVYDENMTFISRIYISPAHTSGKRTIVPSNARYCGLFVASTESTIQIAKLDSSNVTCVAHPYDNPDIDEAFGYWINGQGAISSSSSFILLSLYNVKAGDKYYVSNDATYNGICFDAAGEKLTADSETVAPYGKIFTVPSGAVVMYFNIYTATKTGVNDNYAEYVSKVTRPEKVLCIGDSVTWLDGRGTYGGSSHLMGYQRVLRQNGYDVRTAGYSGYPYAEEVHDQGDVKYSIHNEIVGKEYDLSGYDIIVLVGGLNDISLSSPLGDRCTTYQPSDLNVGTLNGSLSSIIRYIRATNNNVKIVLCTTLKSQDSSRTWVKSHALNDEIKYNGELWSCYLADVFENFNVQPFTNQFSNNFYDLTHPNWNGMGRLGEIILKAVQDC